MDDLTLNFSNFYRSTVKPYSSLHQFDAVNILLLGKLKDDCGDEAINDSMASCYVRGTQPIRKKTLTQLTTISDDEAVRRIRMLGIQDIQRAVDASKELVSRATNLSNAAKKPLLSLVAELDGEYVFVAKVFLSAVRGPLESKANPDGALLQPSSKKSEQATIPSEEPERVQIATGAGLEMKTTIREDKTSLMPFVYSHEEIKVSISYRPLTMPKDKAAVENYFLNHCEGAFTRPNYTDVEDILSGTDNDEYFLAEIRGSYKEIYFELARWRDLQFCTGAVLQFEIPVTSMGSNNRDEIINSIASIVHKGASILYGAKFSGTVGSDQILMHGIFQIRRETEQGENKQTSIHIDDADYSVSFVGAEEEEDPYDEIFRIFNKK